MTAGLDELHVRRGRLLERIAAQRAALARDAEPVRAALQTTDRWLARGRSAVDYVRMHPSVAALGFAALFFLRGGSLWRWSKRGFVAWRIFRTFNDKVADFGARPR